MDRAAHFEQLKKKKKFRRGGVTVIPMGLEGIHGGDWRLSTNTWGSLQLIGHA